MASSDSSSDEFDYGIVNTDEIEIQPFQFEPLPGASKRGNRGGATSRKRRRPNNPVVVEQGVESDSSDESEEEDINPERIGNTDWYVL